MYPLAVIEHLNVVKDIPPCFFANSIVFVKYSFHFKTAEKTFCNGIIPTVAFATHAANHLISFKQFLKIITTVLTAAIRVKNQPWCWFAMPDSHS